MAGARVARLYLLRHAKAGWAMPGVRDFDRPLDDSGKVDAEETGAAMSEHGFVPDITLCSGALRARQTLESVAARADTGRVLFDDTLYITDAAGYLDIIRENCNAESILIIGHNPMVEDLALAVSGSGDELARSTLNSGFPTSGLAVIRFDGGLCDAAPGKGYLETFRTPGE
jgi:phosphohistidine phosphatase